MLTLVAFVACLASLTSAATTTTSAKTIAVCSKSPYSLLIPLATYSSASAYCYSKYPVAAVTTTSTYTPTTTKTAATVVTATIQSTSTTFTTVSYTSTVTTVFIQKRATTLANPTSSLSSQWKSVSSLLSKSGTAAFSTACSCMETAKTVSVVSTASPVILKVASTSTSTKTKVKVVTKTNTAIFPATATAVLPGSCPTLGNTYTDASSSGYQYNVFCKSSYARTIDNTIDTFGNLASFEACIQKCSSTSGCAAVDWTSANKQCYLLSTSTPLTKSDDSATDSAANTNPPPAPGSADSLGSSYKPTGSTLTFTIASGNVYSYTDSNLISSATTSTFQDCVDSCATSTKCLLAFRSRSAKTCLLFNQALQPQSKKLRIRDGTTPTDGDSATLNATALPSCSSLTTPYSAANGHSFNFDCSSINTIGPHSELIMAYDTGRDFSECMDLCSTSSGCVAVTYFPSTNASNNACYILKDIIFGLDPATNVNAAILSTYAIPPQTCEALSPIGPTMTADNNKTYTLSCGMQSGRISNYRSAASRYFKECVYWCSSDSQCQAAEFDANAGLCMLMSATNDTLTSVAGHSVAILVGAQSPSPSQSTTTAQSTTLVTSVNGGQTSTPTPTPDAGSCSSLTTPYVSSNGRQYQASCDAWLPFPGSVPFVDYEARGSVTLFSDCMDICATTPRCRAVDYDANLDQCLMFKQPTTQNFNNTVAPRSGGYDWAQLIPVPGSCESLDIPYTSYKGPVFELKCDYAPTFGDGDVIQIQALPNFQSCVDICSNDDGCDVASYNGTHCFELYADAYSNAMSDSMTFDTARMPNPPQGCSNVTTPFTTNSTVFDVECYTAYSAYVASFEECMDLCTTENACAAVQYYFSDPPACTLLVASHGTRSYQGNVHAALREPSS